MLLRWDITSKHVGDSGLGVGGLSAKISALLAKWGWSFGQESSALWHQIVENLYGLSNLGWYTEEKQNGCARQSSLDQHISALEESGILQV